MGIFPNGAAVLEEQQDEWLAVRRYVSLRSMAALYERPDAEDEIPALGVVKEVIAA